MPKLKEEEEWTHKTPLLFCSALQLCMAVIAIVLNSGQCNYDYIGFSDMSQDSLHAIQMRSSTDWPVVLACIETLAGISVFLRPSLAQHLGGVLPGIVLLSLFLNRLRHVGTLGCMEGDEYCCGANYCPSTSVSAQVPGCGQGSAIYWHDAENFCPWPKWFNENRDSCGTLAQTADITWCFTYGCSFETTPVRYVFNRVMIANAAFIVICMFRLRSVIK